MTIYKVEMTK